MEKQQIHLLGLKTSKEQIQLDAIKAQLSDFPKYFFAVKPNATLIYDKQFVYILQKQSTKVTDLGKNFLISQMAYNHERDILLFLTVQGTLYMHYVHSKHQIVVRKDIKKQIFFTWIFSIFMYAHFFIADESAIKLYKVQDDNKKVKQVKQIKGKYNCFLYEPQLEILLAFPHGDCKTVLSFIFTQEKIKSGFKGPNILIDFNDDQNLMKLAHAKKNLGLQGTKLGKQVFYKLKSDDYYVNIMKIGNKGYLIFYYGNEGKLRLYPISEEIPDKPLMIKLPSDSIPHFNIIDNMLIVHLKNEKITFIYDVKGYQIQMLVSPFPLTHKNFPELNMYTNAFVGQRCLLPKGIISKWSINLPIIHFYLKNQNQIFQFFHRRKKAKMYLLKWLRQQLFKIKQLNLSKFWKMIFSKLASNNHQQRDTITLLDLYANVFYTLFTEDLVEKQPLLNIVMECVRQALQYQLSIPLQIQGLLIDLLLYCQKYELLGFLLHNNVLADSQELAIKILQAGQKKNSMMLQTLGLDMASRVCNSAYVLTILGKLQQIRQMKRFVRNNYQSMEILHVIDVAKEIRCTILQKQYIQFAKFFILQKYPSTNMVYLNEAESKIIQC